MRSILAILLVICISVFSACKKYVREADFIESLLENPEAKSLDTMLIKAVSIKLSREFNPPFTINGKKMKCQLTLVDTAGTIIEDLVTPLKLYVINDDEVWETDFEEVQYLGKQILCYAEGGPKWNTDNLVHIAVRFRLINSQYTIIKKNVAISKLDE